MAYSGITIQRGVAVCALILGLAGVSAVGGRRTLFSHPATIAHGAVYTPLGLRRALVHAPAAWLGRIVWVRARAEQNFVWACRHDVVCVIRQPSLADPHVDDATVYLPLVLPQEPPLWALLGQLPLVERFMPSPHAIAWGSIALYHIQLVSASSCAESDCAAALLVDAP